MGIYESGYEPCPHSDYNYCNNRVQQNDGLVHIHRYVYMRLPQFCLQSYILVPICITTKHAVGKTIYCTYCLSHIYYFNMYIKNIYSTFSHSVNDELFMECFSSVLQDLRNIGIQYLQNLYNYPDYSCLLYTSPSPRD